VPIRFASEAWLRASFDELPSTSGLGAHQYALASMSLEAPQLRGLGQARRACARAICFACEASAWVNFDEPRRASDASAC
jgi:hypothetical protein